MKVRKFNESNSDEVITVFNDELVKGRLTGSDKGDVVEIDLDNGKSIWVKKSDYMSIDEYESMNYRSTINEYENALSKLKRTQRYIDQIVKFPFYLDGEELKIRELK